MTIPNRLNPTLVTLRDPMEVAARLERFIQNYLEASRARGVVLGLSGGVDSSTVASLCVKALGSRRVLCLLMPHRGTTDERSVQDARLLARKLRTKFLEVEIGPILERVLGSLPQRTRPKIVEGNIKARLRGVTLFYHANLEHLLVVGTGDKSEIMLGYFTKYGDGACDILPIGDLYKTSVRQLANHIGVPHRIVEKPSSPELWPGQRAEDELGETYDTLDLILWGLEHWWSAGEIAKDLSIPVSTVKKVLSRWVRTEHKRRMPLIPKLGYRTVGYDFRLPYGSE